MYIQSQIIQGGYAFHTLSITNKQTDNKTQISPHVHLSLGPSKTAV